MKITQTQIEKIIGGKLTNDQRSNMRSVLVALDGMGEQLGMNTAQRLAMYFSQLLHESGSFRYDREIWGNTPAQQRYDTRADLGNTPERDGDGKKNAGRGPIQVTGGANIRAFRDWCKSIGMSPPDFVQNPDLINTDPWEGMSALWYWQYRKINRYADEGDLEMVTQLVNGGRNGFDDRVKWYTRTALVLLGRSPDALRDFQRDNRLEPDGISGKQTRAALHAALGAIDGRAASTTPDSKTLESVQARLRDLGYPEVGEVDGLWGDRTETAILAFRNRAGLPLTPTVDDALLASLMTAQARPVSEERATATVKDLKDAPSVRKGLQLETLAKGGLTVMGLGGVLDGTTQVNDIYNAYNKWQAFKAFFVGVSPWLIGAGIAGVALYFSRDFIREQVEAYRAGRHV